MSTIIQSGLSGGKKVACGGGGGSVSGTSAVGAQSVTLFTTPASPADAEYLVTIGGVFSSSTDLSSEAMGAAVGVINETILVGASAPVAVAFVTPVSRGYTINYRYVAYRNT